MAPSMPMLVMILVGLHLGRYVVMAGGAYVFFWRWRGNPLTAARRLQRVAFTSEDLKREVFWSLVTALVFGTFFGVAYSGLPPQPLTWPGAWKVLEFALWLGVVLIIHDTYFYWSHRFAHHPRVFRFVHRVHHESKNPSPFAALAFHPSEALLQAVWAVPVAFALPIPSAVWLAFAFVAMFINVLGHCGVELYPRAWATHPVLGWLNSATAHNQHHLTLHRNFGLYFTFWDRVMGTAAVGQPLSPTLSPAGGEGGSQ